jgi:ADP-heptose:LPS heptosyltransferase
MNAIVTIVKGDKYNEIWKRTESFFIDYADKCDSELIVLQGVEGYEYPSPHWIKFGVYQLLRQYDRIAFIDADIIIRPDTPSLFDIVPEDQFGIFNEGEYTPRAMCIHEVRKVFDVDIKNWNGTDYYNTGVMVFSKQHRYLFKITEEIKPLRNAFGEQTYINMKLMANNVKIFPLPFKYNRMSIMDRITGMTRLDSYIIHYAGDGDRLLEKMDRDIQKWKEDAPFYTYRRNIFIWSLGGLGDCIASEPVIRYIKNRVYPNDDVYVMSKEHYLYDHIEGINLSNDYPKNKFDAVHEMNTHQVPWDQFGKLCPFPYVHALDWASMATIGRMIPDKDKHIIIKYTSEHMKEVTDICDNPEDLVIVHPGVGWVSKTFPVEYWQKIIDDLYELGFKVGVIGKHVNDIHTILDVKVPPNGYDFRNKLSVKGTAALLSKSRVLVTNDSSPLFIAGAFDNYIVLIPTCKHPDFVMPYRNGGIKYWRSAALYKKVMEDDDYRSATDLKGWSTKDIPDGHTIWEYLPDTDTVIDQVIDFYDQWEKSHCSNKLKEKEDGKEFMENSRNGSNYLEPDKRGLCDAICG